ncbi:natural cytotoxicity triggering receptor 2-like isoform X1 [Vombatus ursinus]|uniref:natural cytotoxicity triggering receptor 2-like isoform X1 n=1 Tax=Vombatus ursinus TaxID=29139 RepID=UPI000FFCECE6|nr:natural cytotoxicity triggering receptor 2-like isoform X1 [Vombatus ursinus]XP_027732348.1 natural cytotoxicity triggering receptor 2-like isoform X1 [Vombatus ursinus]
MAREAPLLLFLMSLGISGSQETRSLDENYLRKEGQMLNVSCSYPLKDHEKSWKVWCKLQENRKDCNKLVVITKFWVFTKEGKFSLQLIDESKSGHIIIIMSGLREKDSGHYWCMTIKKNNAIILKRIHLVVSPAQNTTKEIWTTSGVPSNTPATCSFLEKEKFLILGVVLTFLLLLGVLITGTVYIKKLHQKVKKGDDFHQMSNDFENKRQKSRGITKEMDYEEGPGDIHYASVTYIGPREPMCTNTQKASSSKTMQMPFESVEYASITRAEHQHPKSTAIYESMGKES